MTASIDNLMHSNWTHATSTWTHATSTLELCRTNVGIFSAGLTNLFKVTNPRLYFSHIEGVLKIWTYNFVFISLLAARAAWPFDHDYMIFLLNWSNFNTVGTLVHSRCPQLCIHSHAHSCFDTCSWLAMTAENKGAHVPAAPFSSRAQQPGCSYIQWDDLMLHACCKTAVPVDRDILRRGTAVITGAFTWLLPQWFHWSAVCIQLIVSLVGRANWSQSREICHVFGGSTIQNPLFLTLG